MVPHFVVVFDANVLIPLILPASRSTRLFSRLQKAGIPVAVSPLILDEVREKLRTKADLRAWLELPDDTIERFLAGLPSACALLPGVVMIQGVVLADPMDDKVVAATVEAGASYIVSEDKHLLELGEWQGIKMLSRAEMMSELDRLGVPK